MAMDSANVQLIDCMLMGLTGVYATHGATISMQGCTVRASRSAYDIWSDAVIHTTNVTHIGFHNFFVNLKILGIVRLNSETCKYLVEKIPPRNSLIPAPGTKADSWINDSEAIQCAGCTLQFSLTERKVTIRGN
jgi:hypothetical protein